MRLTPVSHTARERARLSHRAISALDAGCGYLENHVCDSVLISDEEGERGGVEEAWELVRGVRVCLVDTGSAIISNHLCVVCVRVRMAQV